MKHKKLAAMILGVAMTASILTGCGGNAGSGSGNADSGSENAGSPNSGSREVTLKVFDKNSGSKTFDDAVAQQIMEKTGVKIEVENPTGDPSEKLNLMLSGQNYPDIVLMEQGELVSRYIEAGALIELDDLIEQYPNIKEMYGDTLNKIKYTDGKNYWLANWYGPDPESTSGVLMRRDYLAEIVGEERASSPEPFTQTEYLELLRKFKELHPEIDGHAGIPITVTSDSNGDFGALNSMFGIKTYYETADGTLQFKKTSPVFLESLTFMCDLATEGLLDKEWVVNKTEQWQQKMSGGYVFSTFGAHWDTDSVNTTLAATFGEEAQFYCYKVVADGLNADETAYSGRSTLGWDAIGITKNCQDVDAAMRLIDYLVSEEGQYLMMWGVEGEHWTMENGVHVPKEEVLKDLTDNFDTVSNETGIRKWTWFIKNGIGSDGTPYDLATKYHLSDTAAFAAECFGETDMWDLADYSGLEPAGSTPLGLKWQKVQDIYNQTYSKVIEAGSREDAEVVFNNMVAEMEAAGLHECEDYINEQYQKRMEIWGK